MRKKKKRLEMQLSIYLFEKNIKNWEKSVLGVNMHKYFIIVISI